MNRARDPKGEMHTADSRLVVRRIPTSSFPASVMGRSDSKPRDQVI